MHRNRKIHLILVILVIILSIALFEEFSNKLSLGLWMRRLFSPKGSWGSTHRVSYPVYRRVPKVPEWSRSSESNWDPLYELDRMHRWMESWFNRIGQSLDLKGEYMFARFEPEIEIEETDNSYIIRCDLPGVSKDQIEIKLEGQYLIITGKRYIIRKKTSRRLLYTERRSGYFHREILLPEDSDKDNINATYKNGILTVTIPKLKEKIIPKSHKIQII